MKPTGEIPATNDKTIAADAKPAAGDSTISAFEKATSVVASNGGRSVTTGLLAMPLRQYFVWVGGVLLFALFAADWCLPDLPAHPHSAPPPNERISLRIRWDHKWPERIVFDTAHGGMSVATASELERNVVPNPDVAQVKQRNPRDAFAALEAVAPAATNDKVSATRAKPRTLQPLMTSAIKAN